MDKVVCENVGYMWEHAGTRVIAFCNLPKGRLMIRHRILKEFRNKDT
jgi:hypothetical protein